LIKLSHLLFEASDDSRNIIRVLFIDFKKAFELIDHNILSKKLSDYDFPPQLAVWMLSFLFDRKQFVRIGSSVSDVILTNAGAPQGTLAGLNDFKVLINDLCFETIYVKYVDDVTVAAISDNRRDNDMQSVADKLVEWCNDNRMRINTSKTNKMLIYHSLHVVQNCCKGHQPLGLKMRISGCPETRTPTSDRDAVWHQ